MRSRVLAAVAMGVLFLGASSARAALLVFTDESSFLAAIGGAVLTSEGFNAAPLGNTPGPLTSGPLSYNTASGNVGVTDIPQLIGEGARGIIWNDVTVHGDATFSVSSPINVLAIDVKNLGIGGATTLSASVDGGSFFDVFVGATGVIGDFRFLGLVEDAGTFSSVTLSNSVTNLVGLDPVRYGNAVVVPEPATAGLLVAGLALLGARAARAQGGPRRRGAGSASRRYTVKP